MTWHTTQRQRGVSMIESLVALLVLAIGVLGLAGLQTRSLVETRHTNARANALMLANDLAERMRLNRDQAIITDNSNPYLRDFEQSIAAGPTCTTKACTPAELGQFDRDEWSRSVRQLLPGGQARVEAPANNQIRVTFRWRNNIKGAEFGATDGTDALMAPLVVPIDGCQSATDQRNWICHQVFIRP